MDTLFVLFLSVLLGGTAIPLLAMLAARLMRKNSASVRHRLWTVTAVGLLMFPIVVIGIRGHFVNKNQGPEVSLEEHNGFEEPEVSLEEHNGFEEPEVSPEEHNGFEEPNIFLEERSTFKEPEVFLEQHSETSGFRTTAKKIIVFLWLTGMGCFTLYYLSIHFRAVLFLLRKKAQKDLSFDGFVEEIRKKFRIWRRVRFELTETVPIPLALGVFRSYILFPASAKNWTEEKNRAILLHELAHIARGDLVWQNVVYAACIVYWFHPFVWFAARQVKIEQEFACDDMVLESGQRNSDYASVLLDLSKSISLDRINNEIPEGGLAMIRKKTVVQRIDSILDTKTARRPISRLATLGILAATFALVCGISFFAPKIPLPLLAQTTPVANEPADGNTAEAGDSVNVNGLPTGSANIGVPFTFHGTVTVETTKQPIEGAAVCAQFWEGPDFVNGVGPSAPEKCLAEIFVKTDAEGQYSVALPDSLIGKRNLHVKLMASHPDYINRGHFQNPFDEAVAALQRTSRSPVEIGNFLLAPAVKVSGIVQSPDGKPLAGILIRLFSFKFDNIGDSFFAATDEQGRFECKAYPENRLIVWAAADNFAPITKVFEKAPNDAGILKLESGVIVKGKLLDRNKKPAASVWINLTEKNSPAVYPQDKIWRSCLTDQNGHFTMRPVLPGEYKIEPSNSPMDPLTVFDGKRYADISQEGINSIANRKQDGVPSYIADLKPVPDVYLEQDLTVDTPKADIAIIPAQTVSIRINVSDTSGKPCTAPLLVTVTGKVNGKVWHTIKEPAPVDADGSLTIEVPQGLEHAILICGPQKSNRSRPIRFRFGKDAVPKTDWCVEFEKLDRSIDDLDITVIKPAILRVAIIDDTETPLPHTYLYADIEYENKTLFKDNDHGKFNFI
ncbi:MAG: hypothetical protein LBT46_14610, partial [Planctomycetaceae bacterium]|nr:hypothetical protein [Planctomycetaceae bacterium]